MAFGIAMKNGDRETALDIHAELTRGSLMVENNIALWMSGIRQLILRL